MIVSLYQWNFIPGLVNLEVLSLQNIKSFQTFKPSHCNIFWEFEGRLQEINMSLRADELYQLVSNTVKHNKLQEATLFFFVIENNPIGIFGLKGNAHSSFIHHKGCLKSWPVSNF